MTKQPSLTTSYGQAPQCVAIGHCAFAHINVSRNIAAELASVSVSAGWWLMSQGCDGRSCMGPFRWRWLQSWGTPSYLPPLGWTPQHPFLIRHANPLHPANTQYTVVLSCILLSPMHSASATVNKGLINYVRSLHAYGDFALFLVLMHHGRKAASLEELVSYLTL